MGWSVDLPVPRGDVDLAAVVAAVHAAGGPDPVGYVLARLEARRGELAAALGDDSLRVHLALVGCGSDLLVFSSKGAGRLRLDGTLAPRFRPHFTLAGTAAEVVGLVLGFLDVARAVYRGGLVLHVPPADLSPRFGRMRRLVAAELALLIEEGQRQ